MHDLTGQTVLVFGGSGEVGEGISRQLLLAGATVIVPSRSEAKLETLRSRVDEAGGTLHTLTGATETERGMEALRDTIVAQFGKVDHVIASLGGWWQGQPITAIDVSLWQQLLDNSLTAHFLAAKTFLPLLAEGASYTLINGGAALHAIPNVSPVAVSAAAQLKLGQQMAVENPKVRINSLVLATPILTRSRPQGEAGWLSADDAGRYCVYLASPASTLSGETIVFSSVNELPDG